MLAEVGKNYRNLCHAVLIMAIKDTKTIKEHEGLREFLDSEWCEQLCLMGNVDVMSYRKEVARRMVDAVQKSKAKRLKTYRLVEVLHGGKAQGQH